MPEVFGLLHEVDGLADQHLVEGGHVVFGVAHAFAGTAIGRASGVWPRRERAFVRELLLADLAPARLLGRIVGVAGEAMHQITRADRVTNGRVRRVGIPVGIRHGVEVIQIPEELVEAMHAGKVLVQVAEMVLAELPRRVPHRLQRRGDGRGLRRQPDIGARLADGRHPGADRQLAGDELRAPRRAARLGVVIREPHALGRKLVEIWRLAGHDPLMVGANIEPADVVAHDEQDVRLSRLLGKRRHGAEAKRSGKRQQHRSHQTKFSQGTSWLRSCGFAILDDAHGNSSGC